VSQRSDYPYLKTGPITSERGGSLDNRGKRKGSTHKNTFDLVGTVVVPEELGEKHHQREIITQRSD